MVNMKWYGCSWFVLRLALVFVLGCRVQAQNSPPEFVECLENSEFVLVNELVDIDAAVTGCDDRGGDLAVPFSRAENDLLRSLVIGTNSVPNGPGIFLGKLSFTSGCK